MPVSEKSMKIANDFCKYVGTGDKKIIEHYSLEELKHTLYQYARDNYREFYKAMEDRKKELEDIQNNKRTAKERWKDHVIGFVLGLISGVILLLIGIWLKNLLTHNP